MKKLSDYGDVLSVKDVQEILGIGRNAVYGLLKDGTIQSDRLDEQWLYGFRQAKENRFLPLIFLYRVIKKIE